MLAALAALSAARPAGVRVAVVGGFVRDVWLGREPRELDLVVEGDAAALAPRARRRGHRRTSAFGTATATRRRAGASTWRWRAASATRRRGRCPRSSRRRIEEDLARRDFTVNAIAVTLADGELLAADGALEDLASAAAARAARAQLRRRPDARCCGSRATPSGSASRSSRAPAALARRRRASQTLSGGAPRRRAAARCSPSPTRSPCSRASPTSSRSRSTAARRRRRSRSRRPDSDRAMLVLGAVARDDALARRARADGARARRRAGVRRRARCPRTARRARCGGRGARAPVEAVAVAGARGDRDAARRWIEELRHVRLEIGGDDLIAAGLARGREIGRRLERTLARQARRRARGRARRRARATRWRSRCDACAPVSPRGTVVFTERGDGDLRVSARGAGEPLEAGAGARSLDAARRRGGGRRAPGARGRRGRGRRGAAGVCRRRRRGRTASRRALAASRPAVHVADCLPIAVGGAGGVAMLHAGWRGLAGGVVAEGVRALRALGAGGELEAVIGPGAGGCCYETGDEVREVFRGYGASRGRLLDLKAVAARAAARSGRRRRSRDLGMCTICANAGGSSRIGATGRPPDAREGSRGCAERRAGARQPGGGARARRARGARAPGATRATSRSSWPSNTSAPRTSRRSRDAGVTLVGENRAQDLLEKVARAPGRLRWHFIGALQSRKVKLIVRARRADPLGRQRLGAARARAPRAAGVRDPRRGQRRRRAGQGRDRARASSTRSSRARRSRSPG